VKKPVKEKTLLGGKEEEWDEGVRKKGSYWEDKHIPVAVVGKRLGKDKWIEASMRGGKVLGERRKARN